MNKAELVQAMADDAGLSKSDAEKALNAFVEIVGGELGKGGKVQLVGFGTFGQGPHRRSKLRRFAGR